MALERKPLEEPQEPGYPSTTEYVTGRRAFIGLLGLTAVGVGAAYLLRKQPEAKAQVVPAGTPRPPVPPAVPQSRPPGVEQAPLPVEPKARIEGDTTAPKPPEARPIAPPPGAPPRPKPDEVIPDAPKAPVVPSSGVAAPQAAIRGEAPAQPMSRSAGKTKSPE